jgi:hypothetical protein
MEQKLRKTGMLSILYAHTPQTFSSSGPIRQFDSLFALTSDNRRLLGPILYHSVSRRTG